MKFPDNFIRNVMATYANPKYPGASRKLRRILINGNIAYLELFLSVGAKSLEMGFYEELVAAAENRPRLNARKMAHAQRAELHQEFQKIMRRQAD
ncbi:MAG: hypothetical protein WCO05_04155 [Candidatus Moraniibacteriota bacterium]